MWPHTRMSFPGPTSAVQSSSEPRLGGTGSVRAGPEGGAWLAVLSAYRNFFSSERASRRLCRSKELASQRFTWDKLKRAKHIPEDFRMDSLRGHRSRRDEEAKNGGRTTRELPVGQGSPVPPWSCPPQAKCDSLLHREARIPRCGAAPGSAHPILAWPASHMWPGAGTGVDQRTQGPSVSEC